MTEKRAKRAQDLPTASSLARARERTAALEPGAQLEAGLKEAMERVLALIGDDCAWIDAIENRIESLWLHFGWLEAHRKRLRGLCDLSGDLEQLAEAEEAEGDLLASLPILCIGQSADLIFESEALRVWLTRVPEEELAVEFKLEEQWREVWRGRKVC